jgi:hypothetical protein
MDEVFSDDGIPIDKVMPVLKQHGRGVGHAQERSDEASQLKCEGEFFRFACGSAQDDAIHYIFMD